MTRKLWVNVIAGAIDFFIGILGLISVIFQNIDIFIYLENPIKILIFNFTVIRLIFFILAIISWLVHLAAFIEAYHNDIYNVGNVLGIMANGLVILKLGKIKKFIVAVYLIASFFGLVQKKLYLWNLNNMLILNQEIMIKFKKRHWRSYCYEKVS